MALFYDFRFNNKRKNNKFGLERIHIICSAMVNKVGDGCYFLVKKNEGGLLGWAQWHGHRDRSPMVLVGRHRSRCLVNNQSSNEDITTR